jgi:hypothetical protein
MRVVDAARVRILALFTILTSLKRHIVPRSKQSIRIPSPAVVKLGLLGVSSRNGVLTVPEHC